MSEKQMTSACCGAEIKEEVTEQMTKEIAWVTQVCSQCGKPCEAKSDKIVSNE